MSRQTRNSRESAEDGSQAGASEQNVTTPRTNTSTDHGQPSAEFLATVIAAVKSALRDEPQSSHAGSSMEVPSSVPVTALGSSVDDSSLSQQAHSLHSSGEPPSFAQELPNNQDAQGRSVTFVPTSLQSFQQPFIVGPGYSLIPFKLVSQIMAGKFIELAELLSVNLNTYEAEPQVLFDGRLVVAAAPRKSRRQITDIVQWMEAFTIYSTIIVSQFPHRWKDLMQYKLLILGTYRQYAGRVWHSYDVAFREQASALRLVDWSQIDVQLFNFHAAGASVKGSATTTDRVGEEARGNDRSAVRCISWNSGKCLAPSSLCKFAHACLTCFGDHRRSSCLGQDSKDKRRSASPPTYKHKRR